MIYYSIKRPIMVSIFLVSAIGCTEPNESIKSDDEIIIPLTLSMNANQDGEFYIFKYPRQSPSSYTSVEYKTDPITRVFWTSPDSFTFIYWGREFTEPIINYSTYSRSDGTGKQMIYLYEDFIGDTLTVEGCVYPNNCKSLSFIVQ